MPWQVLPTETEIVPIHAALLATSPQGDIVYFGDWSNVTAAGSGPTLCRLYHMAPQSVERFASADTPSTSAFCGGQAQMSRGLLLVAGGTVHRPDQMNAHDVHEARGHWDGERACWIYEPDKKRWRRAADLNFQPGSTTKGGGRWYPTLVTLGDGQVFAVGGHPSGTDDYVTPNGGMLERHNNNTPERYSPNADAWTLITPDITALNAVEVDAFPRYRLLPNGLLFTDTQGMGAKQMFDPIGGHWTGPDVNSGVLPADYARGSSTTSVLLPLLPPNYSARVLAMNSPHPTTFLIDLDAATPAWQATPNRSGSAAGKQRNDASAVILPTGEVLLSGGTTWNSPTMSTPVFEPELYTPDIDWSTGAFTGPGSWATINEAATVARGYHSVALLLPDGRVWTAGTTQAWSGLAAAEKRVEVFSPWYVGVPRPRIVRVLRKRPPGVLRRYGFNYGETFKVTVIGTIARVALLRCGAITHGYDSGQRYVGLVFTQAGDTLSVTTPPRGSVAPPGYYMLWVIDTAGVPCERALFVHLPAIRHLVKPRHPVRPKKPKKYPPPKKKPHKRPAKKKPQKRPRKQHR